MSVPSAPTELTLDQRRLGLAGAAAFAALAALPAVPGHDALSCPLRSATGVPCPFCGMTRGVARLLDGDVAAAIAHNPGSLLLLLGLVALLVTARRAPMRIPTWAPLAALAALWSFQLVKLATGQSL